jgi:TonB family protein
MFFLLPLAFADDPAARSPETVRWEADARRQISSRWDACVDALPLSVRLPEPTYTTVSEFDVNPDGTAANARIVQPSGSDALDACALQALTASGRFPVPPDTLLGTGKAHLADVVLKLNTGHTAPPPPPSGKAVELTRVPTATVPDIQKAPTRIATTADGARNIWCGGPGDAFKCSVRDAHGSMLVFSITACHHDADLSFQTAYGPMLVRGAADLLPEVKACE